jgi:hypothetical protein
MDAAISLRGRYDLHVHASPSIARRKFTALEALKLASIEGMGGVLLLDHTYNTAVVAQALNELGHETKVFGSMLLNEAVGGLNPNVVETAIQLGAKQIQMPTYSSRNHKERYGDDQKLFPYQKRSKGISVLDQVGRLLPEVEDILLLLKGKRSFLGTGHLSAGEIETLVSRAEELGVSVLVSSVSTDIVDLPLALQKRLAADNVFMEHDYMVLTEGVHKNTPIESIVEQIRAVSADRCVIATDAGQPTVPDLITGFKEFIRQLLEHGITESELDCMTIRNPRILLGIS